MWCGARLLGFVPQDADCIAHAWQAQTQRTGNFDATCWPCEAQDFSLSPTSASNAFAPCPASLGLYAVLPDAQWVARMVDLGVPTVQLRFKSDNTKSIQQEVLAAVKAVEGSHTHLFINDHWQVAIDAGAYGVHLGQEDMELASLDAIRSAGLRLGLSSHGYAEMLKACAVQPSYLALGAVFPTTLKRMATAPQGLGRLAMYARLMRGRSLVAIGGIDIERLPAVMQTGVGSAAFVRAITAATDVSQAVAQLHACLTTHLQH
jgi:thiamine-phosphate pyrophosphorylase